MNSYFRKVVGVVLTSQDGAIYTDEKKPMFFKASKPTRKLDQAILTNVIRSQENGCVFVMGENTYNELTLTKLEGVINEASASIFVSNDKAVYLVREIGDELGEPLYEYEDGEDTLLALRRITMASMFSQEDKQLHHSKHPTLMVLGGISVYNAFAGMYHEIHHSKLRGVCVDHEKKLNVHLKTGSESEYQHLMQSLNVICPYSDPDYIYNIYY